MVLKSNLLVIILFQTEQEFLNCIDVDKNNPYIEDMIAQKKPLVKVLRLICLQCITSSGFKPKLLDYYKRELFQVNNKFDNRNDLLSLLHCRVF